MKRYHTFMGFGYDVVNFHFINRCNFECKMCFVSPTLVHELEIHKKLLVIDNIIRYFKHFNLDGRINLVGGEPLLSKDIGALIHYIHERNCDVSIVTNGSLLSAKWISSMKGYVSMIGISIDSIIENTDLEIGRHNRNKQTNDYSRLVELCDVIKSNDIKLKINVCIQKSNLHEDLTQLLDEIKPDRLKLLQVSFREGVNDNALHQMITTEEMTKYCEKYAKFHPVIEYADQIDNNYVMINADGNLMISQEGREHIIGSLLDEELTDLLNTTTINTTNYQKRYSEE